MEKYTNKKIKKLSLNIFLAILSVPITIFIIAAADFVILGTTLPHNRALDLWRKTKFTLFREKRPIDELLNKSHKVYSFPDGIRVNQKTVRFTDGSFGKIKVTTDDYNRRSLPLIDNPEQFLVMAGCSYIWGTELNDQETLPYLLQESLKKTQVYNYGYEGGAQHLFLGRILSNYFQEEIKEKQGHFLYFVIDRQLLRGIDPRMVIAPSFGPSFSFEEGHLNYYGNFEEINLSNLLVSTLKRSNLYDYFQIDITRFWSSEQQRYSDSVINRNCLLFSEINKIIKRKFPQSHFTVIYYPGEKIVKRLTSCLKEEGVDYLDLTESIDMKERKAFFREGYGHPTFQLNKTLSSIIAQKL